MDLKGDLVYEIGIWKVYRQDAGMGEYDYAVIRNGVFFARTELLSDAQLIIFAVDQYLKPRRK